MRLCGWVASRREHGEHLAFVDLRDYSGITQCVVDGSVEVRSEWVVAGHGTVRRRPDGAENPAISTGEIELGDCVVEVLSKAETPPFPVDDRRDIDESIRLRYRYVDMRRPRMQQNIRLRSRVLAAMRHSNGRARVSSRWRPRFFGRRPRRGHASSRCLRGCTRETSTFCLRAPRSRSSCSWLRGATGTSRSRVACATRTFVRIGSSSSPSWTSRCRSPAVRRSRRRSPRPCSTPRRPQSENDPMARCT